MFIYYLQILRRSKITNVLLFTLALLVFSIQSFSSVVSAQLSPEQLQLYQENILYFDNSVCGGASSGSSSVNVTAGSGAPDGAAFPNLDPTAMANAINTWITQQNPKSELSGLGSTIVASAKNSNVNPFLIVAIAHEESSLSDPSDFNVSHGNNSFGRTAAAGQPSFQGSRPWYKWSSVKASVDFTAPENQGAYGGGDIAAYLRSEYGSRIDANDITAIFEAGYAPPNENNTAQYLANLKVWISALVGLTTGTPSASTSSTSSDSSSSTSSSSDSCSCSSSSNTNSGKPTIVLDPGHSGISKSVVDPQTGLIDFDYPNVPEITEVFNIAQDLKTKLTAAGYNVVLTKQNVDDYVSLRQRADIANQSNAALAVSIHDDHTETFEGFQQIYDQQVGAYRTNAQGQNTTFTNQGVAAKSAAYSNIFAQTRQKDEGIPVTITLDSFNDRSGFSPGNIPLVQLFANVPWVYNEVGASDITPAELQSYSNGILDGIEQSVPISGTSNATSATGSSSASSTTASSSSCGSSSVNCSTTPPAGLSQVRQEVVCGAQNELATWQSQPGYPWSGANSYASTGYLKYSNNRQEEWCADFASWVYNQANYPIGSPNWDVPAVSSIQAIGEQNQKFSWHSAGSYTPKPGDLAIHGGDHVNIVTAVNGNTITLIGGDQGHGPFPGGSIVSTYQTTSPAADGITGFVSPNNQ